MEAVSAPHTYSNSADVENISGVFIDAGKFLAEARQRMNIRLQKIRGEKTDGEDKVFTASNEYSR